MKFTKQLPNMRLYHVTSQETKDAEVKYVWFATEKSAKRFVGDLSSSVASIQYVPVEIPAQNRTSMAVFLNCQFSFHRAMRCALDDDVLEAHINAKTVHLLPVESKQ